MLLLLQLLLLLLLYRDEALFTTAPDYNFWCLHPDEWVVTFLCLFFFFLSFFFFQGPLTHSHVFFPYLKRFATPPIVLATPSHQFPERPQDAMAVWVEGLTEDSFKICLREVKIFDGIHKGITIVSRVKILYLIVSTCLSYAYIVLYTNLPEYLQNNQSNWPYIFSFEISFLAVIPLLVPGQICVWNTYSHKKLIDSIRTTLKTFGEKSKQKPN